MLRIAFSIVFSLVFTHLACAETAVPKTAIGEVVKEWIEAVNSADRERLQAFKERYRRKAPIESLIELRAETGGFDVIRVERSEPSEIAIILGERAGDDIARLEAKLDEAQPSPLRLSIERIERPADLAIARLDAAAAITSLIERIDTLAGKDQFSGRVVITRKGKPLFARNVGEADRETHSAIDRRTRFRIGSMNKMFTAVAILQLVESGKLSLDTRVGEILKDYPNRDLASKVSIRHLLTHTGGTGDIFGPEFDENRLALKTHNDYLRLYGARDLEFEPGAEQRYSNYGFILLGAIIETLSGTSYYEHVQRKVFDRAGMRDTSSPLEIDGVANRVKGYMHNGQEWVSNADTLPWRGTAAGGGLSTPDDLARFAKALLDGRLLSKKMLAQATAAQVPGYGYGFGVMGSGKELRFGHGGGAPGMNGELIIVPSTGTVIIALSNLDPPAATRIAHHYFNRMPLQP
jgi:D-alanyl-D-alanine carboxypeptidase